MAGAILKDRDGNEVEYPGVVHVKLNVKDSDGKAGKKYYTNCVNLRMYACKEATPINNKSRVTVLDWCEFLPVNGGLFFGIEEGLYKEHGIDYIIIVATTRSLTIGETYYNGDLFGNL